MKIKKLLNLKFIKERRDGKPSRNPYRNQYLTWIYTHFFMYDPSYTRMGTDK